MVVSKGEELIQSERGTELSSTYLRKRLGSVLGFQDARFCSTVTANSNVVFKIRFFYNLSYPNYTQ